MGIIAGECQPLTGWPQQDGVTVYANVATEIPAAPNFIQTWANADGYLVPTGNYAGVLISNDTRSFVPLRGTFPVKKGQYIALQGTGTHTGRLQTDIWPTDMTEQDLAMLAAYVITAPTSELIVDIYDYMSNRAEGGTSTSAANSVNIVTITAATWQAVGSRISATGAQAWVAGGSVASDTNFTISYDGAIVYSAVVGAGMPRGSVVGFDGGFMLGTITGDVVIRCGALGAGVTSTMNYSFKIAK